jgi:hypothetical protein
VINSLKTLLSDESLITKWIEIYKAKTKNDLPDVQAKSKQMDQEILATTKKIANLVQRVAELPAEVPADAFYEQIKQMNHKLSELKLAKEKLNTKEMNLFGQDIDQDGLKKKIERAIQNLEKSPKEKQRAVFSNLVKFVEIHPMKIKIGMLAPTKMKATGTDGEPLSEKSQNLQEKEGKLLEFDPNRRGGSSTVGNGAPGRT